MANTDTSQVLDGASSLQRLSGLRTSLSTRLANYRTYRATLAELSALSDREFSDVGLIRGILPAVAAKAAYKV